MANARVLLVANTSWYLYNFRLPLLRGASAMHCGFSKGRTSAVRRTLVGGHAL